MRGLAIASRAFGTPLALEPGKAELIARVLGRWMQGRGVDIAPGLDPDDLPATAPDTGVGAEQPLYDMVGSVAVVQVGGTLVNRGAWIGAQSGITSYQGLRRQFEAAAADDGVSAIALEIDSPGGEVAGLFDLCAAIRAVRAVKPVHAFIADQATSAAYGIAAQATGITVSRTGWAGHIGTVIVHADMTGALDRDGIAVTLIQSGARKTDGTDLAPLSDTARSWLQAEADAARSLLAEEIAAGRGPALDAAAALATEARIYTGRDAVSAGLADRVADPLIAFRELVADANAGLPASTGETRMGILTTGAPQAAARGGMKGNGPGCRIGAGEGLARALEDAIGRAAEGREGDDARASVVAEMASAAGIEPGTVDQILAGSINCPPRQRLEGFARVLPMTVDEMIEVAEREDGCDYTPADGADAEEAGEAGEASGADAGAAAAAPAPGEAAARAERTRIQAILTAPEAQGREPLARHFAFESAMGAAEARRALAAAPSSVGLTALMQGQNPPPAGGAPAPAGETMLADLARDMFRKGA